LPYNLYFVGGDVKPCLINQSQFVVTSPYRMMHVPHVYLSRELYRVLVWWCSVKQECTVRVCVTVGSAVL